MHGKKLQLHTYYVKVRFFFSIFNIKSRIYFSEITLMCKKGSDFDPRQRDKKMSLSRDKGPRKRYSKPRGRFFQILFASQIVRTLKDSYERF